MRLKHKVKLSIKPAHLHLIQFRLTGFHGEVMGGEELRQSAMLRVEGGRRPFDAGRMLAGQCGEESFKSE